MAVQNPYGVGASGESAIKASRVCLCCEIKFEVLIWKGGGDPATICGVCVPHAELEGEPLERVNERLSDHLDRWRLRADAAAGWASRTQNEMTELRLSTSAQVSSALSSRDGWKENFRRLYDAHTPNNRGACAVCRSKYPCPTVQQFEGLPKHIQRYVERGDLNKVIKFRDGDDFGAAYL